MKPYRLFWKLFFAFWVAMMLTFAGTIGFFLTTGAPPPPPDGDALLRPIVPIVSAVVTSLSASLLLAWYLTRPLRHVRWALDQLAGGRFETRVKAQIGSRRDEIADLGGYLDATAERLERLEASRQQLLHDISHELRSPLSRLRAAIGLARTEPADVQAMLARVDLEADRLNGLLDDLLTLSRIEAGSSGLRCDCIDVIELLHAICADAEFEAKASGRSLSIRAPGTFITVVDGDLIYRALENVIRNAVKYSEPATVVDVAAQVARDGDLLEVVVGDRGPGVPDEMLVSIFDPFVRGPAERTGATGFGLGLAIAQRALLAHGGEIFACPRAGGGLSVTLRLPRRAPEGSRQLAG
jgi:signal transduction histidine kinase